MFFLIWKIFFFILIGIFAVITVADAANWGGAAVLNDLKIFGYILAGMTALVALGYLIYAAAMGWKYCVLFEMDEKGVNHKQVESQAKKAKKIAAATVAAGIASGRFTTVGVGLTAARTEMYSEFEKTKTVKAYPRFGLIKVNEPFGHNQVYAEKEDFEFVKNYILAHCDNLKTNRR